MDRRGFTLLEVLVAVAILGLVMLTVYGTLARSIAATRYAEDRAELYASGREQVMRMADEIESALPPSQVVYFVGEHLGGTPPTDTISFYTIVRRTQGAEQRVGGLALVVYSLDPDPSGVAGLFALRRHEELMMTTGDIEEMEFGMEGEAAAPAVSAVHLIDRVAGLRFDYIDPETGEFVEGWDTTKADASNRLRGLPAAVRVTLFLADQRGAIHDFGTIVDLPLTYYPERQQ